jgi:outer membrane protein assembly factor BamB
MRVTGVAFGLILFCPAIIAANWPEWRGATRDGITTETNLPAHWSATENIQWKAPLPGPGNSTPVVWGHRIFLTQAVPQEGKRLLMCFDRNEGKVLWQKGALYSDKEESHEANPLCSSSPSTDGSRVVAWFGSAGLFCYDIDGKELWKRNLGRQHHEWGYASSPVIHQNFVFLNFGPGENSFIGAFDRNTGKDLWRVPVVERHYKERNDGFNGQEKGVTGSWCTPIIVKVDGKDQLILSVPDKVTALDPETGKEIWFCRGLSPLSYTSPVYGEGLIVATGSYHAPDMMLQPGGHGDITAANRLWEGARTANRLGSPVIKDGYYFVPTMPGVAECIEMKTGKKAWEERTRGHGPKNDTWSSPVLSGDRVYLVNQSSETIVLRAAPKFEILAINSLDNEMSNSSLVVSDGELFIRTYNHLWCIGGKTTTTASR